MALLKSFFCFPLRIGSIMIGTVGIVSRMLPLNCAIDHIHKMVKLISSIFYLVGEGAFSDFVDSHSIFLCPSNPSRNDIRNNELYRT